jgi:hypothetical protein
MKRLLALITLLAIALVTPSARAEESSVAHKIGGAMFLTGGLIIVTAIAVPLAVCKSRTETDPRGYTTTHGNCDDLSDGTKAAWIAGAGVGLTLTVFGGILYFETEPKPPTVALTPWVTRDSGGATFVARF